MNRRPLAIAVLAILVPVAVFVGWRILTLGLADHWAVPAPARALAWRPAHPDALREAAADGLRVHLLPEASRLARSAVAAYPLEGRTYRTLAAVAEAQRQAAQAAALYQIAAIRAPRDLRTRAKLAELALRAGHFDEVLHQLDINLRTDPEIGTELLPQLLKIAAVPATEPAFIKILARNPTWRKRFLVVLTGQARDSGTVDRIYSGLQASATPPTSDELTELINRQMRDNRWSEAYVTWVSTLPPAQLRGLGNLFDGDFAFPPGGGGFGWLLVPVVGAQAQFASLPPPAPSRALTIDFDGIHTGFHHAAQVLTLSPGSYRLTGKAEAEGLETGRGLQWVVLCAGSTQPVAKSPLLIGSQRWTDFAMPFEIPATECSGQVLRLQMGAPDRIIGHAAYAQLAIERLGGPAEDVTN